MGYAVPITRNDQFVTIDCCKCGVTFAVASTLEQSWRYTKAGFYCPNGHSQAFVESTADRIKREMEEKLAAAHREIDAARKDVEWARVRANNAEKRVSVAKGQITKLRKRVGNGVCPCCNRTFKQLAQHMAHKHPEFKAQDVEIPEVVE